MRTLFESPVTVLTVNRKQETDFSDALKWFGGARNMGDPCKNLYFTKFEREVALCIPTSL